MATKSADCHPERVISRIRPRLRRAVREGSLRLGHLQPADANSTAKSLRSRSWPSCRPYGARVLSTSRMSWGLRPRLLTVPPPLKLRRAKRPFGARLSLPRHPPVLPVPYVPSSCPSRPSWYSVLPQASHPVPSPLHRRPPYPRLSPDSFAFLCALCGHASALFASFASFVVPGLDSGPTPGPETRTAAHPERPAAPRDTSPTNPSSRRPVCCGRPVDP